MLHFSIQVFDGDFKSDWKSSHLRDFSPFKMEEVWIRTSNSVTNVGQFSLQTSGERPSTHSSFLKRLLEELVILF